MRTTSSVLWYRPLRGGRFDLPAARVPGLLEEPDLVGERDVVAFCPMLGDAPVLDAI
jgi:hypothetical protein